MRIGLFFGSFDPIHIGHISIISSVLNSGYIDKVIVIPAWHNPAKESSPAPFLKRWMMCYVSTKNIPEVECSQIEGTLYDKLHIDKIPTYKVIDSYKEDPCCKDCELYIITTSETFSDIVTWDNGEDIINSNNFIIIEARGQNIDKELIKKSEHHGNKCICCSNLKSIDISSTEVRDMVKKNKIVIPYITEGAQLIIKKFDLYK